MRSWLSCLVVLVLLAGCLDVEEDPDVTVAGAADAPQWAVGDWWTYEWESEIYGFSYTTTVVVGTVTPDGYGVGMDLDDYQLNALLFHLPAIGPVTRELGYGVHEVLFEPLRFPLHDGSSWEATYVSAPVHLTAHAQDVATPDGPMPGFRITNEGHEAAASRAYNMEYAPSVGWFTLWERVDLDGRLRERITLVDHGSGHVGTVRVPGPIDVPFIEARTVPTSPAGIPPGLPVTTFDPDDALDYIFVACLFGDAPGVYEAHIDSPSGVACTNQGTVDASDTTRRIQQAEVPNVAGDWTVRLLAGGTGLAIAEVLGYTAEDVTLGG